MSEAGLQLTVPRELTGPDGGFNINVLMFLSALGMVAISTLGYWSWHWPDWCCFCLNVVALHLAQNNSHKSTLFCPCQD